MRFKVYGPYDIVDESRHANWIAKEDTDLFWKNEVLALNHELLDACGVYIFGIRGLGKTKSASTTLPWYVGKAERQTFKSECFSYKNLYSFNSIFTNKFKGKGIPFLYMLARVDENDNFSPTATKEEYWGVRFVEEMFIQMSLSVNRDLLNKSKATMARQTSIQGLLNTKTKNSDSVNNFKDVFGIGDGNPIEVVKYENTKFRYGLYGPHKVPVKQRRKVSEKTIDQGVVDQMWDNLGNDKSHDLLNKACGVYVVGMQNRNNTTPWYIGTAHDRSFREICFNSYVEKEKIVNRKGQAVIYFLPRLTNNNIPAKRVTKIPRDMEYVQRVLFEYGVQTNGEILVENLPNDAQILRDLFVEGFVNPKQGKSKSVGELKSLLSQK